MEAAAMQQVAIVTLSREDETDVWRRKRSKHVIVTSCLSFSRIWR